MVQLKSGEVAAPLLRVVRPNFRGFMGGVRYDPIWEGTFQALAANQPKLDIPADAEIDRHIVLIHRIRPDEAEEDDVWRIWAFTPAEAADGLAVPDVSKQKRLVDEPEAEAWLTKLQRAEEFVMVLRER